MRENKFNSKIVFSLNKIITYFIIISFLFPRGYLEYSSIYKIVFTCCIWISTLFIWAQFLFAYIKDFKRKELLLIMEYFILTIIITILLRGVNINGLQKLFAYPSIFIFIICKMKREPKGLLNAINNVMLIIFVLNQLVARNFFFEQYHITFLGHVQLVSQLGILSIFCALLYWLLYREKKKKIIFIVLISLFTMFITDASTSLISSIILVLCIVLYKLKLYHFLTFNFNIYIIGWIILNITIVGISIFNNIVNNNGIPFLDFSGRSFIWIDALSKIKNHLFFGYGIEGVLLNVFWSQWVNSDGFNYAHNQLIQNLLDGGIVVLIAYFVMIFSCFRNIKNIKKTKENYKYKILVNAIWIIYLFIMIFESTSLYCYMYMFLAIVYILPSIINNNSKRISKK